MSKDMGRLVKRLDALADRLEEFLDRSEGTPQDALDEGIRQGLKSAWGKQAAHQSTFERCAHCRHPRGWHNDDKECRWCKCEGYLLPVTGGPGQ